MVGGIIGWFDLQLPLHHFDVVVKPFSFLHLNRQGFWKVILGAVEVMNFDLIIQRRSLSLEDMLFTIFRVIAC